MASPLLCVYYLMLVSVKTNEYYAEFCHLIFMLYNTNFQRNICYYLYLWACLCVCVHVCTLYGNLREPEVSIRSFGTGVIGSCGMPMCPREQKEQQVFLHTVPLPSCSIKVNTTKKHLHFTPEQR